MRSASASNSWSSAARATADSFSNSTTSTGTDPRGAEHQVPLENEQVPIPGCPQRPTSDVHRLVEVMDGVGRILTRPQRLEHAIARDALTSGQRKHRHEMPGPTQPPLIATHRGVVELD